MRQKQYRIAADKIVPVVTGWGAAMATDRITVDGSTIGYAYREAPINDADSGWRFFAGDEDGAYMADPSHHDVYAVNTIANYDPAILSILESEIGSAFERDPNGPWRAVVDQQN
ncbi:DUF2185 domain-containing protein [Sphingomonas sp. CJ20]